MTPAQFDCIPDHLFTQSNTAGLREWLHARGWRMTLTELDHERRQRRTNLKEN